MSFSVIVVDDEDFIANNIAKNVERMNPSFVVKGICSCGSDAIEMIKTDMPDVVITDICMPEVSGLELAKFLSEEYPSVICVIVSGYDDFSYARKAISYHVNNYLLKPVNKEELRQCLGEIEKKLTVIQDSLTEYSNLKKKGKSPEDIVELVKEYIHQNYNRQFTLSELADQLGFSSAYLTKIFTRHTDMAPARYLKEYRMTMAMQMLKNPDIPINIISQRTGFQDQFHFSRAFKAHTGISPTSYRRTHI